MIPSPYLDRHHTAVRRLRYGVQPYSEPIHWIVPSKNDKTSKPATVGKPAQKSLGLLHTLPEAKESLIRYDGTFQHMKIISVMLTWRRKIWTRLRVVLEEEGDLHRILGNIRQHGVSLTSFGIRITPQPLSLISTNHRQLISKTLKMKAPVAKHIDGKMQTNMKWILFRIRILIDIASLKWYWQELDNMDVLKTLHKTKLPNGTTANIPLDPAKAKNTGKADNILVARPLMISSLDSQWQDTWPSEPEILWSWCELEVARDPSEAHGSFRW